MSDSRSGRDRANDMNPATKEYLKQVRGLFPLWGRAEQQYIKGLAVAIEDYFGDCPPESVEEIWNSFDPPQDVAKEYLTRTDINDASRRVRNQRLVRRTVYTLTVLVLLTVITLSVHFGLYYKELRVIEETQYSAYIQGE